ncbi:hypothetical protein ABIB38_000349 [Massilia sp. UYP11]|uniref:polysaccharide deacetylase family protein n=1 Tax=Massilia sp. UYP11 TaxID=1756385 RepID=UPI003D2535A1
MLSTTNHVAARLAAGRPPVLIVIVDTEEEFAWDKPFDRANTGTTSVAAQPLMHDRVFDRLGIVPAYMVDWPVATAPAAAATLRSLMREGRCEIGTQLHPWVSPPYDEQVTGFNSYAGNLPRELELAKVRMLTTAIGDAFDRMPTAFKAGRYGLGPHSAEAVAALGYEIDASVVPYTRFEDAGAPDFRSFDEHPYWFEAGGRRLLELPVTTGYAGWLRGMGPRLFELARAPAGRALHMGGVLARSGALERIRLSPEVATGAEMRRLTRALRANGCEVFSLTYHSPSLVPGHTPYVRDAAERERLVTTIHDYCTWFRDEIGGEFLSMSALPAALGASSANGQARGEPQLSQG